MRQWIWPALGAFVLWGLWSFIPKFTTRYIGPRSALLFEVLGGMIVAAVVLYSLDFKPQVHPKGVILGLTTGILGFSGALLFLYAASRGPISIVAVLSALYPLIAVVLAVLFLREPLTLQQALGIALGLASILLIVT